MAKTTARRGDSHVPAEQWPPDGVNTAAGLRLEAFDELIGEEGGEALSRQSVKKHIEGENDNRFY